MMRLMYFKVGEWDNFVKLNINGKGGCCKFINGFWMKWLSVYGCWKLFKSYKKVFMEDGEFGGDDMVEGDINVDIIVGFCKWKLVKWS